MSEPTDGRVAQVSGAVENWRKLLAPMIGILVTVLTLTFAVGQFWSEYRDNATNGSPAVKKLIQDQADTFTRLFDAQHDIDAKQSQAIDRLTTLQEMTSRDVERRLSRLEEGKR